MRAGTCASAVWTRRRSLSVVVVGAAPTLANRQAAFAHDGMPIGIKDIIETIDMPTENGSPLLLIHRIDGPQIGPILAVCGDVRLDIIKPTASGGLPLAKISAPLEDRATGLPQ